MCGIAGFFDPEIQSQDQKEAGLQKMLETIAHRGPDYRGTWHQEALSLGHNRLSIIDLSEAAHQPFHYHRLSLVFNGEIYNYKEIRQELQGKGFQFSTSSDTEVICAAYKHWGESCVSQFMGMWAFALWDEANKKLFCSRDRFGIKPFYYQFENGRFYFGSEYKALKKSPLFKDDYNQDHLFRYLQLGWLTFEDQTFYSNLHALPEAYNLVLQHGQIKTYRYWDLSLQQTDLNFEDATAHWKELFLNSMEQHMRADTPVGGCLSGGLDSSAICSSVGYLYPELDFNTFTIYYSGKDEVDERPWAQHVWDAYPNLKSYTHSPKQNELLEQFEHFFYHFDVPPAGSSPLSQYFVMRLAKEQGMKVLLDGQGADEYLAGYDHSFYRLAAGELLALNPKGFVQELEAFRELRPRSLAKHLGSYGKSLLSTVVSEESLYQFEYRYYLPFMGKGPKNDPKLWQPVGGSRLNQFLYQLTSRTSLPSLLHNEDRNSMTFSIESRVPFLDHRLVEFSFQLPDTYKLHLGWSKKVLRESMRGIMPSEIIDRKDKKGFVTPGESKWLRGSLKPLLEDTKRSELPYLSSKRVRSVIEDYEKGSNKNARLVWRLAMLHKWVHANNGPR